MYCQNCGKQVNESLNYCNNCGVKLAKTDENKPSSIAESLTVSLGYIGGFGFAFLLGAIVLLLNRQVEPQVLVIIVISYLATLLAVCYMILRQISNFAPARDAEKNSRQIEQHKTAEFTPPRAAAQIDAAHTPPASVTDHTTKTLDEVPVERKQN